MPKIKYSKDQLIKYFRPRPIESLQNANYVNCLQLNGQLIKVSTQFPVNYYKDELVIKGFNQEILVYSGNTPAAMKSVVVQGQAHDLFRFDEQQLIFTPQPQANDQFFPALTPQPASKIHTPIFSFCRQMRYEDLQDRQWFYIDDSNDVQGPFSSFEMDSWYSKGYFDDRTEIAFKNKHAENFIKLKFIKHNKYIKGEAHVYKQIIGRRRSAPPRLSAKEQQQFTKVTQQGPQTTLDGVSRFDFGELEQLTQQQTQQHEENAYNDSVITKLLAIPSHKLVKKKDKQQ